MSRSGYQDDVDQKDLAMWRGRVASAMRGKRGQRLLRDCLAALDAMPVKRLITEELESPSGEVCTLGAVMRERKIPDLNQIDPEDHGKLAGFLNVAPCLIQEIEFENDERYHSDNYYTDVADALLGSEQRWRRMRKWLVDHIAKEGVTA